MRVKFYMKFKIPPLLVLLLSTILYGCTSYTITEKEMTNYLNDEINIEESVGIHGLLYARVNIENVKVTIGRISKNRISVFANTRAEIQFMDKEEKEIDLDIEFSSIPEYDNSKGEIYLKSLRLENFNDKSEQLSSEIISLLKPAVSLIGNALSNQPAYKLNSKKLTDALIKSTNPNLIIKDNKLIIELLD